VVGEHRTLKPVKKVYLRDTFGPYQVHVYTTAPVTIVSTTRR
jgi:hypothetical protein